MLRNHENEFKICCLYGGVSVYHQEEELKNNPDVVIATPGRLVHMISEKKLNLEVVENFVMDEVDQMLDMGFEKDID